MSTKVKRNRRGINRGKNEIRKCNKLKRGFGSRKNREIVREIGKIIERN